MKLAILSAFGLIVTLSAMAQQPSAAPDPSGKLDAVVKGLEALNGQPGDSFTPRPIKDFAAKKLYFQLDHTQIGEAARRLVKKRDQGSGMDFEMLMAWARQDPKAAFEHLRRLDPKWLDCALGNELFQRWAAIQPDKALEAAKSTGPPDRIYDVLGMIAVDSPARALDLLPVEASRQYGFARDVLAYWAGKSPDEATRWVLAQPKRGDLMWNLAYVKAQLNHEQGRTWALSLAGDDRIQALAGIVYESVHERAGNPCDPEMVGREFLEFFPDTPLNQDTIPNQTVKVLASSIAQSWATKRRFAEGLQWILRLKPSNGRDDLLAETVVKWADKEPAGALAYATGMSAGRGRDMAVLYSAPAFTRKDAGRSFRLASEIKDASRRKAALTSVFRLWLQVAPRDAIRALDGLPQEEAKELESGISDSAKRPPRRSDL